MSQNSIKWNYSEEKIFEIIHLTLIDILKGKEDKTCYLKKLVPLLNLQSKVNRINDDRKYNLFSKYLKIEHNGFLNFIKGRGAVQANLSVLMSMSRLAHRGVKKWRSKSHFLFTYEV